MINCQECKKNIYILKFVIKLLSKTMQYKNVLVACTAFVASGTYEYIEFVNVHAHMALKCYNTRKRELPTWQVHERI